MPGAEAGTLAAFRTQIDWCERLGSPFTARLLSLLADDLAAGGDTTASLADWPGDPTADALPLRVAGALHALVLTDAAPALAALYPPHAADPARLRPVLLEALSQHRETVGGFLALPPQTNEVGRSAVLLGGYLQIAHETGLPLRLLEIGASAGLNTVWDRYHYRLGDATWGAPDSPVRLAPDWKGPLPPLAADLRVAERQACDIAPVDLEDPAQRLRLRAYVWADQHERAARLQGAIAVARAAGQHVQRADAADWVRARLAAPSPGRVTVLAHSIMWQYMPARTRHDIRHSLHEAGRMATGKAPLAWLRFEPDDAGATPELRLTLWPDGRERCLGSAQAHGSTISWRG